MRITYNTKVWPVLALLLLVACGARNEATEAGFPTPTPDPRILMPEAIPIHPSAYDFEADVGAKTYSYYVKSPLEEVLAFLTEGFEEQKWELLSPPSVLDMLATFNVTRQSTKMNVSLQNQADIDAIKVQMIVTSE